MKSFLTEKPAKSFVIIGPPETQALEQLLDQGPDRAVILEPNPERARVLDKELKGRGNVQILPGAIGIKGKKAELVEFNFPGLRSLLKPSVIMTELFPGLHPRTTSALELQPIEAILGQVPPLQDPIALWIDLPGSELDLLEALKNAGVLDQVQHLTIQCSIQPMFEDGPGSQDVVSWLQAQFFQISKEDYSDPDWPILQFVDNPLAHEVQRLQESLLACEKELLAARQEAQDHMARQSEQKHKLKAVQSLQKRIDTLENELLLEREALEQSKAERARRAVTLQEAQERTTSMPSLKASLEAVTQDASIAKQKLSEAKLALAKSSKDLKTTSGELATAKDSLHLRDEKLTSELARISDLETIKQEHMERIEILEEAASRRTEELERMQVNMASVFQRDQALKSELKETREALSVAQTRLNRNETDSPAPEEILAGHVENLESKQERKVDALTKVQETSSQSAKAANDVTRAIQNNGDELAAARAKIEKLQSDLSIALRMQQLAQADTRELRDRYQKNEKIRETQSALLQTLTPRLQQAATQLQQLVVKDENPVALEPDTTDTPAPPSTRSRKTPAKPTKRNTTRSKSGGKK